MSEIPDDVTEAARVALMKAADLSLDWEALTFDAGAGKNVIAEAIMAERERTRAMLLDPVAVHANLLRGTIAKPTADQIVHLYGGAVTMAEKPGSIMAAIQIVGDYLKAEFIVANCREHRVMGCASCEAVDLYDKLEMLVHEITDEAHHHYPAKAATS